MPIYEYHCVDCDTTFQRLRPMSKSNAPAPCDHCGSSQTSRAISLFSAISKGSNGESQPVRGSGGGCGSCSSGHCASCNH